MRIRALSRRFIFGASILSLAVVAAFCYPSVFQLGLTISKPGVQPGYVIFGAPDGNAYAIDTQGKVAKKWPSPEPNTELGYTRPLANGNLLARIQPSKSLAGAAGANAEVTGADSVIELTQEGRVVWKYTDRVRSLHHDEERMANGNTLIVCSKDLDIPTISRKLLKDDCLIEVDGQRKIVWEWQTADHIDDLELPKEVKAEIMNGYGGRVRTGLGAPPPTKGFDYLHMNAASPIPESAGHMVPRFKPGNIIVSDPVDTSISWEYSADKSNRPIWSFFSHYISGAQRQPNGNTLICEGANGRIFEVTQSGEIVWEYVNPFPNLTGKIPNSTIFRAAKVAENWLKR